MLSEHRFNQHRMWIEGISFFQTKIPSDYKVPRLLSELRPDFAARPSPWSRNSMPETQVYIQGLPEFQERELFQLTGTGFGMCRPGNPLIIGVKVIYE